MLDLPFLIGREIERPKPCKACGSVLFKVESGTRVHAAHLRCAGCARGGLWLTAAEAERLDHDLAPTASPGDELPAFLLKGV
jgi:hypothetical protein